MCNRVSNRSVRRGRELPGLLVPCVLMLISLAAGPAAAATIPVTNNSDAAAGSLRDAITQANMTTDVDTITFGIGMAGSQQTITLMTALPNITQPVTIDGWSQGGAMYMGPPLIEVVGVHNMMSGSPVLRLDAAGCTVRGLALVHAAGVTLGGDGIVLASNNNWVYGCYVGLGLDGDTIKPNHTGIYTNFNGNVIGTNSDGMSDAAEANVVSGNLLIGIVISGGMSNRIAGNLIGTDKTGLLDRGNASEGVEFDFAATGNIVGGSTAAQRNIISGNDGNGIAVLRGSTGNAVLGNYIGTNLPGTGALANAFSGIRCAGGAVGNSIGGTGMGSGNRIAFNGGDGVVIDGDMTTRNAIVGNSIFSNGGLGIDLSPNGVTPNDPDPDNDADTGPNNLQNFPDFCIEFDGSDSAAVGFLQSEPSKPYRIEFFASGSADPSGYGEGEQFIGFTNVMTNATGLASFNFPFVANPGKPYITATATEVEQPGVTGAALLSTSEFSKAHDDSFSPPMITCDLPSTIPLNENCQATVVLSATITDNECLSLATLNVMTMVNHSFNLNPGPPVVVREVVSETQIHVIVRIPVLSTGCEDEATLGGSGYLSIEFRASDCCGNMGMCFKTTSVLDQTPPVVQCRITNADVPVPVNDQCEAVVLLSATIRDNCCIFAGAQTLPSVMVTTGNASLGTIQLSLANFGQKEVRVEMKCTVKNVKSCPVNVRISIPAKDCCNNRVTQTCDVEVIDNVPPTIACPPSITIESCVPAVPENTGFPMAMDNCTMQVLTTSYADVVTPGPSTQGSKIVRTWTAMDACGNSAMCTQDITILVVPAQTTFKGDLFVWPHVRIKWDDNATPGAPGDDIVLSDTLISVTNDDTVSHPMKFYFVEGRTWANANRTLNLTANQSRYWSAFSGQGGSTSGMAFRALNPLGLPDGPNANIRKLEGFILGFTIDENGKPFGSNQIAAGATIVDREREAAWAYKPWGFRSCFTGPNMTMDKLCLNGLNGNYQMCPSHLLVDFWSAGTPAFGPTVIPPIVPSVQDFEVTLVNMAIDLRAVPDFDMDGTPGEPPIPGGSAEDSSPPTTAVEVLVWNESEIQVSNTVLCLTCWDTKLASMYGVGGAASPFAQTTLQTNKGKARLRGKRDSRCDQAANSPSSQVLIYEKYSKDLPILAVVHKIITWGPDRVAKANSAVTGMGGRADGFIQFDTTNQGPPPTLTNPAGTVGDAEETGTSRLRR